MGNIITFGNFSFDDSQIVSINIYQELNLICEALSVDTLNVVVRSNSLGDGHIFTALNEEYKPIDYDEYVIANPNILDYKYGQTISYIKDQGAVNRFYIEHIDRIGTDQFRIQAISAIGLLDRQQYHGGVYQGVQAGTIINEIMADTGINIYVNSAVSNTLVRGYLPYASKRECLQQLLFAIGANVRRPRTTAEYLLYSLRIDYITNPEPYAIPDNRIYLGGTNSITSPVTKVSVTEHNYYQNPSTQSELIYSHTGESANHQRIVLDEPIVPSTVTTNGDITIHEVGANYIDFSGTGSIYAIKYTHISMEVIWESDEEVITPNECKVTDATLVTATNSANVLKRLVRYYTQAKETNCAIVTEYERPGSYITFTDPFGDEVSGFIKTMQVGVSDIDKANATIITDWYPTETGNNFNNFQVIQSTGVVNVPTSAVGKPGRLVLFGGFCGGQGGTHGLPGKAATDGEIEGSGNDRIQHINPGLGGESGGKGGKGGSGVMIYTVNIDSLPNTFTVNTIGEGGLGGAAGENNSEGAMGSLGGDTTVTINGTNYSSASGAADYIGFINVIDGTFYNLPGMNGYDNTNAHGGNGSEYTGGSESGSSVTIDGVTWRGGKKGKNAGGFIGGAGGSAAYGSEGHVGGDAEDNGGKAHPGSGGSGADAATPRQAAFPYCGQGGSGGGAGGGAGGGRTVYGRGYSLAGGGRAGHGSAGGQGSNGAVLFYYGT